MIKSILVSHRLKYKKTTNYNLPIISLFGRNEIQFGTNEIQFSMNETQFSINEIYILFLTCNFHIYAYILIYFCMGSPY